MWHVCETERIHTRFWWGDLRERNFFGYVGVHGIPKLILNKWDGSTDGISLAHDRVETGGGRL